MSKSDWSYFFAGMSCMGFYYNHTWIYIVAAIVNILSILIDRRVGND